MSDDRKFVRRSACGYYHVYSRATNKLIGRVVNMSLRGIMLISEEPIEASKMLKCKMELPEEILESKLLNFDAESKWCRKNETIDCYETGFLIHGATEKDDDILKLLMHIWMAEKSDTLNLKKAPETDKLKIRY